MVYLSVYRWCCKSIDIAWATWKSKFYGVWLLNMDDSPHRRLHRSNTYDLIWDIMSRFRHRILWRIQCLEYVQKAATKLVPFLKSLPPDACSHNCTTGHFWRLIEILSGINKIRPQDDSSFNSSPVIIAQEGRAIKRRGPGITSWCMEVLYSSVV